MHPQFDHIATRVHEVLMFMKETPEFKQYDLDWIDIEIKCVITARREITDQSMMTKGRLLDIIEEIVCDEIEIIMKENFTVEINDALVELLDEGKIRMLVNEDGELVYEINDDE
jgi:hypothetical protein